MKKNLVHLTKESLVEYMYKVTFNSSPNISDIISHIHNFFFLKRENIKYNLNYEELENLLKTLTRRQTSSHNFFCLLNHIISHPKLVELSKSDFRHIFNTFPRWMLVEMTEKIAFSHH